MAKSEKKTGYALHIAAFIPADLSDMKALADLQDTVAQIKKAFGDRMNVVIKPTRQLDA